MDGKSMLYKLRQLLNEEDTGTFLDDRTSYDFLWEAATAFVSRTNSLTSYQDITTVANQVAYTLDAKFLKLYLRDRSNRFYVRYRPTIVIGAADSDEANKLHDADGAFTAAMVGATVWNVTDETYTTVSAFVDSGELTLTDDIMVDGDETYIIYSADSFLTWKDYENIIYANQMTAASAVDIPNHFSIRDRQPLSTLTEYKQITGTVTTAGTESGGECTLTDTSGTFTSTDYVSAGDTVHNTDDNSVGVVLSVTDANNLVTALFGGTDNDWTKGTGAGDAYVIQPQGRLELILDPPPDDASDTVRVWYVERPEPVYSDYGMYRFRMHNMEAIIKYAAWLYKYRDSEPNFGDEWYKWWDRQVREETYNLNPTIKERKWGVNLKRRR